MESLLTTDEVAGRLGISTKTVLRYLQSGKLRGSQVGRGWRIPESAIGTLLQKTAPATARTTTPRVTAVVNQKGGVGKTTTTFNLGVALHKLGRRVLLVDLDPQAALSASAGIPIAHLSVSIYQALIDDKVDPRPIVVTAQSGVDVLPATIDLAAAEVELVSAISRELVLKDLLAKLKDHYDHILIDCPPSLGLLTINALAAADQVLIPLQCEYLATRGLALLMRTLEKVRARLNRGLRVAGILPTMFLARTTHANEILEELHAAFPGQVYDIAIKHAVRLKESPAAGLSIFDYDPHSDVATAYMQLALEVDNG